MYDQNSIGRNKSNINPDTIAKGTIGIEREALRLCSKKISSKPHPTALGSALLNKYITTDFSEAQIELISPPKINDSILFCLENIHHFTSNKIGDETLWPFSIPPTYLEPNEVGIANYGSSNVARLKSLYRKGLSNRYGKIMQTISGIHFNYSFPETYWDSYNLSSKLKIKKREEVYFRVLRNIKRNNWIILFLFGCSPVVGKNLIDGSVKGFISLNKSDYYLPFATSLRMSDLGYKNSGQLSLNISYDSLEKYISTLRLATQKKSSDFSKIGIGIDDLQQINSNLLQIEDEYYSVCRPKSKVQSNIRPSSKLEVNGVDYIELRSLDINPFCRTGIDQETLNFLEVFLIYCSQCSNKVLKKSEIAEIEKNDLLVSRKGRKPGLKLLRNNSLVTLKSWAEEIIDEMFGLASILDDDGDKYSKSISKYFDQIKDPKTTISSKLIDQLATKNITFNEFGQDLSEKYKKEYIDMNKQQNQLWKKLEIETIDSLKKQKKLERDAETTFNKFLNEYLSS